MKKRMIFALIAAIAFSGCSSQQNIKPDRLLPAQQTEQIAFEGTDTEHYIQGFTVISDSGIASLEYSPDGNERGDYFRKYEKDTVTFEKKLSNEEIYDNIIFDTENNCYYAYDPIGARIKRLDESFDYLSDLAELEAFEIKGMDIIGDFLYVLSVGENPYTRDDITEEENGYMDFGEKAYRIELTTGRAEEIGVNNPICQFYDGDALYYYTCESGKYEVKRFDRDSAALLTVLDADDVGYIVSFVLFENKFIYSLPDRDHLYLKNLESGLITSYANGSYCLSGTDMRLYKGNLIFLNRNIMQVEKLALGEAANAGDAENPMKFAREELVIYGYDQSNTILFSEMKKATGITATIYQSADHEEEILLKLMACDSDVDIYNFYSTRPLGRNVRKFGAYEPLNDCEKINDFFSECHEYLSDFFTNENGDLWSVPTYAGTMAVFYVPENIEELGLSYEDNFKMYPDFLDTLLRMTDQDRFDHYGYMESIASDILEESYNVNYSYTDYHTDVFKTLLQRSRSGYPRYTVSPFFTDYYKHDGSEFNTEKTAFKVDYLYDHMKGKEPLETWRVFPSPKVVSVEDKSPVIVSYAVVNPYSKKVDAAKEYLSAFAEDFLHTTSRFSPVYRDIEKYAEDYDIDSPAFCDIFDISANAAVYEPIGSTDGMQFLSDYHDGKITVDEVVREYERRAEIALKE
ncbi:MAG: ABC transporter substrate-binding protein [Bacteroides sp.]|nr:ABC transporter substrate-binding protein [Eubacterium sp.]MCM1418715.1 ABC transporter substrate-binding protein [Roseburia sp.]MCM1462781.1 ABC transporter substrate-binding protein [Bacteroides sp.]